jgi:DNA polymerase-1
MSPQTPLAWLSPVPAPRDWRGSTYPNKPKTRSILKPSELPFREIWMVDTEFNGCIGDQAAQGHPREHGNQINPICLVAREFFTRREIRLWHNQLRPEPPYPIDDSALFVCFSASAENGFHLACGWPRPACILDLYAEFINIWNGLQIGAKDQKRSQLNALVQYGIIRPEDIVAEKLSKEQSRDLILAGDLERLGHKQSTLDYCAGDVTGLEALFVAMLPEIFPDKDCLDEYLHYAMMRGTAAANFAVPERNGIPMDVDLLGRFNKHRMTILETLISATDQNYGVFKGTTLDKGLFANFLTEHDITWPRTESGQLATDIETFEDMALEGSDEQRDLIKPLETLAKLIPLFKKSSIIGGAGTLERKADGTEKVGLVVGRDARNRTGLMPFGALTARCTPSTSKYIWQWPRATRSFIKPDPGTALMYFDWSQQEIFIAAGLSFDLARMQDYQTGDTYTAFGKRIGLIPKDWPKKPKHPSRGQCKICELSIQYLRGAAGLARVLHMGIANAKYLLDRHRKTYSTFWTWSEAARDFSQMYGYIQTMYGWVLHVTPQTKVRTVGNFPMQAHGAHMLHLALGYLVDAKVKVAGTVHDAIFVECPMDQIEETEKIVVAAMERASGDIVPGYVCRVDVHITRDGERYVDEADVIDEKGDHQDINNRKVWKTIMDALQKAEEAEGGANAG